LKDVDIECLKTCIRNILLTRRGTRRMLPDFGANLEDKLFEPLDEITAKAIGKVIMEQINQWDTSIIINQVSLEVDEDRLRYNITIHYSGRSVSINRNSIKFVLEKR
jgi:phage baseplate assembly protein W